ncbi:L-seryl-tRNA(Sec) selenium transferase [Tenggerimyces flavus]|uniref:L-seryl-tRNA(Sec) selenium transferase n=1 Tax=Tenggerimyces flavus TaxID=1708749 RepID=A0ABV7YKI2_9ACTN|nr:L-seryl-tRNA(Sec) selenium transferase [Tenggerimyces flavus]MBM7784014.1 L-seryl-tRNA(Ser) seleniumtransferase [Tenggerimyces flavus]
MVDPRRLVPRTDTVLGAPELADALAAYGREAVKAAVGVAQERVRAGSIAPNEVVNATLTALSPAATLRPVINATGVLVHTNLGRAALSEAARVAVVEAAGSTDVEFDLATGARARRGRGALAALAAAVPDAEAVHVVNNNAAALLLCALVLAPGREIVLSRGELVEIGDGFRIPELLASTGARLREVGTTNRTSLADYRGALGPDTGFVLKVHPSNFQVTGFTATVPVPELAGLGVPVVVDIGSGLLRPHPLLPDEPDASTMLRDGAALVTASGDKLLGGPQAGLIVGQKDLVEKLRRQPSARALRVDKLTLAALEATLTGPTVPVVRALELTADELRPRAERLAKALADKGIDASVVACASAVGGGGAPGVELPSWAVSLPEPYAAALRQATTPVVGYVRHGRCLLDLRTVEPAEDAAVEQAVLSLR